MQLGMVQECNSLCGWLLWAYAYCHCALMEKMPRYGGAAGMAGLPVSAHAR